MKENCKKIMATTTIAESNKGMTLDERGTMKDGGNSSANVFVDGDYE